MMFHLPELHPLIYIPFLSSSKCSFISIFVPSVNWVTTPQGPSFKSILKSYNLRPQNWSPLHAMQKNTHLCLLCVSYWPAGLLSMPKCYLLHSKLLVLSMTYDAAPSGSISIFHPVIPFIHSMLFLQRTGQIWFSFYKAMLNLLDFLGFFLCVPLWQL